jgi:hypothetical protein
MGQSPAAVSCNCPETGTSDRQLGVRSQDPRSRALRGQGTGLGGPWCHCWPPDEGSVRHADAPWLRPEPFPRELLLVNIFGNASRHPVQNPAGRSSSFASRTGLPRAPRRPSAAPLHRRVRGRGSRVPSAQVPGSLGPNGRRSPRDNAIRTTHPAGLAGFRTINKHSSPRSRPRWIRTLPRRTGTPDGSEQSWEGLAI